jgi:hypothetical protein
VTQVTQQVLDNVRKEEHNVPMSTAANAPTETDTTYAIVEARLDAATARRDTMERHCIGLLGTAGGISPELGTARQSLRDQVILLRSILAEADHS